MGTRSAAHSCWLALEIVNAQKTLADPEKGEAVMACEYEYTPKEHRSIPACHWGVCLCTLTGKACIIRDDKEKHACVRRLYANQYQSKYSVEPKPRERFTKVKLPPGDKIVGILDLDPNKS